MARWTEAEPTLAWDGGCPRLQLPDHFSAHCSQCHCRHRWHLSLPPKLNRLVFNSKMLSSHSCPPLIPLLINYAVHTLAPSAAH